MPSESETERRLRERRLIFYEDDVERINKALENYQSLSKSKCNILIDIEGHPVTQVGSTDLLITYAFSKRFIRKFNPTRADLYFLGGVLILLLLSVRIAAARRPEVDPVGRHAYRPRNLPAR